MVDYEQILGFAAGIFTNMDDIFSIIFVLMLVFTFIDGSTKKKGGSLPPPDSDFDIPALKNDPEIEVRREVVVKPKKKMPSMPIKTTPVRESGAAQTEPLSDLTTDDALNAIVLAEILDKPKALRRR